MRSPRMTLSPSGVSVISGYSPVTVWTRPASASERIRPLRIARALVPQDAVGGELVEPGGDDFLGLAAGQHLDDAAAAEARLPSRRWVRRDMRATPLSALRTMMFLVLGGRAGLAGTFLAADIAATADPGVRLRRSS